MYVHGELSGTLSAPGRLSGTLTAQKGISGTLTVPNAILPPSYEGNYEVTPTEAEQTLETNQLYMVDDVTVHAIPSDYVGSDIPRKDSADLTASGDTVSVPGGYYAENASKAVASGSRGNSTVYVNTTSTEKQYTVKHDNATSGYYDANTLKTDGTVILHRQQETITPSESTQTATPTSSTYYLDSVTVNPIPSQYIVPSGNKSITANGTGIDVTQYATADVSVSPTLETKIKTYTPSTSQQTDTITPSSGYDGIDEVDITIDAMPSGSATPAATISATGATVTAGTNTLKLSKTVSNTPQVSAGYIASGTAGNSAVSLTASVNTRSSSDLTASGATVTAPSGYYGSNATKTISSGTEGTPTATKGTVSNHAISVTPSVTNTAGYISGGTKTGTAVSVSASEVTSGTKSITSNGTGIDVTEYASVDVAVPSGSPNLQTKTKSYTPTESQQTETVSADSGYDGLDEVDITVGAISSTYVGTGITQRTSSDLSASGATVTAPSGYYASAATKTISSGSATPASSISATGATVSTSTNTLTLSKSSVSNTPQVSAGYISSGTSGNSSVSLSATVNIRSSSDLTASSATVTAPAGYYANAATKSVTSGTAGTPTATKGTVSNHAISVTPSVTNTTGYITGGTKTGTAVSVSASDVCSGSETKTANGTYDVTNLAELVVNVSGGGGDSKNVQVLQSTSRANSSSLTKVLGDLTVSKTGTYDIYWSGGRTNTSTSYTWGTRLYVDGSGYGTENTSWSNNCQSNHLSNVSLTANQKLSVYARGRSGSYYTFVPMLVIVES